MECSACGFLFPCSGCRLGLPGAQFFETYHLRPKSASFNYLLSRELESLLSAQKQLIIAAPSYLRVLLGHRRLQPELSVDFGVSSGILYIFKFSLETAFILKPMKIVVQDFYRRMLGES